jgi:hypothetical protein
VREFQAAAGLPDSGTIDAATWQRLRALPEPSPDIPTRAVSFIAREEVGSRGFYDAQCARPTWPGGASGVTIGVGYDLGYQAGFAADWSDLLTPAEIARLKPWLGLKGQAAKDGPAQLTDITIPWHAAWTGFIRRTCRRLPTRFTFTGPVPAAAGLACSSAWSQSARAHRPPDRPGARRGEPRRRFTRRCPRRPPRHEAALAGGQRPARTAWREARLFEEGL